MWLETILAHLKPVDNDIHVKFISQLNNWFMKSPSIVRTKRVNSWLLVLTA
jgi:hypothetical protein